MKAFHLIFFLAAIVIVGFAFTSCAPREYTYCWDAKTKEYRHCKKGESPGEVKERGVRSVDGNQK